MRNREPTHALLLGVDGGGTRCRARLATSTGEVLGEGVAGPANIRLGLKQSLSAVVEAAGLCFDQAGLPRQQFNRVIACLALAGASEPAHRAAAQASKLPFRKFVVTTDAQAACIGAHGDRDGGIIIAGTGAIGWAVLKGRSHRIGGWGLPISDEGSGAWLGREALRRVLWAHDGRIAWSDVLRAIFAEFDNDPHAIVRWTQSATPGDFGTFAPPVFDHAERGDPVACDVMRLAAGHIDAIAGRLVALGSPRLALVGGCAPFLRPWLAEKTAERLVAPAGDALDGALALARTAVLPLAGAA